MREWFIVGAKLLGIYFLYWALTTLPFTLDMLLSTLSGSNIYNEGPSTIAILTFAFSGMLILALSYALLFKTEIVADKLKLTGAHQPSALRGTELRSGISLLGIYFFCTHIGALATVFARTQKINKIKNSFAATQPEGFIFSADYFSPCVTLTISLMLIFGSKYIAAFLTGEKSTETEQAAPLDRE